MARMRAVLAIAAVAVTLGAPALVPTASAQQTKARQQPAASTPDAPPPARTVDVVDRILGLTLPDPYRWMEGQDNPEFQGWLKAQGEYTRGKLDALPGLAAWQERLKRVSGATVVNRAQRRAGDRVFFIRMAGQGTGTLMVREGDGRERALLDPAMMGAGGGSASITAYAPSPDGRRVAVNIDHGGSEITRIQIFDVATAHPLPDAVEPVWGEFPARWLPDGSAFAYTQMVPDQSHHGGDPLLGMRVRLHRLGTPANEDPFLLRAGNGSNPHFVVNSRVFPEIQFDADSPWAVAFALGARHEQRVCVAPRREALTASAPWRCLADYANEVRNVALHGDVLYLLSMRGSPNGRLLALDLSRPEATLGDARAVLPMADDAIITDLGAAKDALYVKRMANGIDSFLRLDYASGEIMPVAMPFAGAAYLFDTHPAQDGLLFTLQSWTVPRVAYLYEPATARARDLNLGQESPADYSALTSIVTEVVRGDGARVPLSIVHRKDVVLDGQNRALVFGYGGYGTSIQPFFSPLVLEWVKAGGIFAVAHVRGGGEKGDAWHRAGQGANKHVGVADLIASAEHLATLGYTTPERTALDGGSAGALIVGGAVARAPEKFGAAIIEVGALNPVRLLAGINGENQIAELGDPGTADGLKALAAMDPYQNIRPGVRYPAVLLTVGLNDGRVSTWETGKFAAKLRTATTSGKPIWIRTDGDAGHGVISLDAAAAETADGYAFLEALLPGRLPAPVKARSVPAMPRR